MKKPVKLLSVLLAFVMVISVFAATMAQAAAPYKPTYNDDVTEKDVELLLKDVDTVLSAKVLTGSVIESIYKALPGLTMLIGKAKDVEFYSEGIWNRTPNPTGTHKEDNPKKPGTQMTVWEYTVDPKITTPTTELNQERFADLYKYGDGNKTDFMPNTGTKEYNGEKEYTGVGRYNQGNIVEDVKDESGNITTEGTFTRFFKDHPIVVNSLDDFKNEINNIVATVLMDGLGLISALGAKYTPAEDYGSFVIPASGGAPDALYSLFEGLDDICAGLGIEQPTKATACFVEWNSAHTSVSWLPDVKAATTYVQNIVSALFKDGALATNVVGAIQSLVVTESGAQIYKGVNKIVNALEAAINSPFGANLGKKDEKGNWEEGSIAATLHNIYTIFQSIPTLDPDTDKERLDIEGLVNFLIGQFVDPSTLALEFVERKEGDGKAPKGLLNISAQSDVMPLASDAMISLKFRHMILDRVAEAESHADVVKIVYDYLYDNLICYRETNELLKTAFTPIGNQSLIERVLKTDIPKDIEDEILNALKTDREPLADHLITLVAEMDEVHHHRDLQAVAAKPATCTEAGTIAYYHCPDCGLDFATDDMYAPDETALTSIAAPAKGHHVTKVDAKDATCTEAGNVEYYRCDDCGLAFKTEADAADNKSFDPTVKATGHKFGDWKDEDGKQVRTCTVCGVKETKGAADKPNAGGPNIPNTGIAITSISAISVAAAAAFVTMSVRAKKKENND